MAPNLMHQMCKLFIDKWFNNQIRPNRKDNYDGEKPITNKVKKAEEPMGDMDDGTGKIAYNVNEFAENQYKVYNSS